MNLNYSFLLIKQYVFTKNGAKYLTNICDSYFSSWNKYLSNHPCWAFVYAVDQVDQVSIKTSHVRNYSASSLAANTELQITLSLSRDHFKSCFCEDARAGVSLHAAAFSHPAVQGSHPTQLGHLGSASATRCHPLPLIPSLQY